MVKELLTPSRWRFAPQQMQLECYRRTAGDYDADDDLMAESLHHIVGFIRRLGIRSVWDSGCGTARGIRYLQGPPPR